jgi:hypothetical protein
VFPRRERVALASFTDITLHRGETHPESTSGFALTHPSVLDGLDYLPTQIFGVRMGLEGRPSAQYPVGGSADVYELQVGSKCGKRRIGPRQMVAEKSPR